MPKSIFARPFDFWQTGEKGKIWSLIRPNGDPDSLDTKVLRDTPVKNFRCKICKQSWITSDNCISQLDSLSSLIFMLLLFFLTNPPARQNQIKPRNCCLHYFSAFAWGSSINDVTQFLTPPHTIVTVFITKALVLSSQIPWPPPPMTVTSFMDDPLFNWKPTFILFF